MYELLNNVISMDGFNFATYRTDEITILTPRLKELGYENIEWRDGERDSFGPLSRICRCTRDGRNYQFFYG